MLDSYDRLAGVLFNGMQKRSRERGHELSITVKEFQVWCKEQDGYVTNCKKWFFEGSPAYGKSKPSCNRLDDTKGYEFSNMEMITWGEHINYTVISGIHQTKHHPVSQPNNPNKVAVEVYKDDNLVFTMDSIGDVARRIKPDTTSLKSVTTKISAITRGVGRNKSLYGYTFKFKD